MTTLSEAGVLRRQQMRCALLRAVVWRRRRRLAARAGALVAVLGTALWSWTTARGDAAVPTPAGGGPRRELCAVAIEHDDPAIVERLRIEGDARVHRIEGDEALAATLAGFERTAGVGRIAGRLLIPGLVVDAWQ